MDGTMATEAMNIGTRSVAELVQRQLATRRYQELLDRLQAAAGELGYRFVKSHRGSAIPCVLDDALARAVGGAQVRDDLVAALGDMGIRIRATDAAAALIAAVESQQAKHEPAPAAAGVPVQAGRRIPRMGLSPILGDEMEEPDSAVDTKSQLVSCASVGGLGDDQARSPSDGDDDDPNRARPSSSGPRQ